MSLDDILASASSAVESGDDAARTNALGAVETGVDHVINEQANQGIRAERLSSTAEHLTDLTPYLKEKRASLEETDLPKAIANIQQLYITLEATQAGMSIREHTSYLIIKQRSKDRLE